MFERIATLGRPAFAADPVRARADHHRRADAAAAGAVGLVVLQPARRQRDQPPGAAAGARPAPADRAALRLPRRRTPRLDRRARAPRTCCSMSASARASCRRSRSRSISTSSAREVQGALECRPQAPVLHRQRRRRRPDADRDPAQRRRRHGGAGAVCAADLRLELRLRAGAGRPGAGAVRPRHLVHAPRAGADRASRRRGRRAGQGPRRARLRLLRRHPRGAQRRDRLPDHGHPPAPLDPAAHRDAGRRQPRSAHAAHPHEAVAGAAARIRPRPRSSPTTWPTWSA